jgi:hypothetical protein
MFSALAAGTVNFSLYCSMNLREEDVVGRHVADACETKFLQQTILQRAVR